MYKREHKTRICFQRVKYLEFRLNHLFGLKINAKLIKCGLFPYFDI